MFQLLVLLLCPSVVGTKNGRVGPPPKGLHYMGGTASVTKETASSYLLKVRAASRLHEMKKGMSYTCLYCNSAQPGRHLFYQLMIKQQRNFNCINGLSLFANFIVIEQFYKPPFWTKTLKGSRGHFGFLSLPTSTSFWVSILISPPYRNKETFQWDFLFVNING